MALVIACIVAAVLGAGIVGGIAATTRSVERSANRRERGLLEHLLEIERARNADLLTRLAARNVFEYRAVAAQPDDDAPVRHTLITDDTGLIAVDADDESNVV